MIYNALWNYYSCIIATNCTIYSIVEHLTVFLRNIPCQIRVSGPNLAKVEHILNMVVVGGKLTASSGAEAMFTNQRRKPNNMVAKTLGLWS